MAYLVQRETQTSPSAQLSQPEYTLYLSVQNCSEDLQQLYRENALKHNENMYHNDFPDSGFDVFVPKEQLLSHEQVNKVDLFIKCEMVHHVNRENIPTGFYLYPRSSISKTKFRLANNVGIIDSGYRGNLGAMFDVVYSSEEVKCEKHTRLVQICGPMLKRFKVVIVDSDSELSTTRRGSGGFGSTGSGGCML
jgi:dUTP pyrophosphatase